MVALFFVAAFRTIKMSPFMNVIIVAFILFIVINFLNVPLVAAQMQNERYNLMLDSYEPEEIQTPSISPTSPERPTAPLLKKEILKEPPATNISIDIDSDLIDFGVLSPTSPTTREMVLSLFGTTPYQALYVQMTGSLSNDKNESITQTLCDQGGCSEYKASEWINTLTFGVGYSCNEPICDQDFKGSRYRPFSPQLVSIYQGKIGTGNKRMITLPIKINTPGTQTPGSYRGSVTILTVPSL